MGKDSVQWVSFFVVPFINVSILDARIVIAEKPLAMDVVFHSTQLTQLNSIQSYLI